MKFFRRFAGRSGWRVVCGCKFLVRNYLCRFAQGSGELGENASSRGFEEPKMKTYSNLLAERKTIRMLLTRWMSLSHAVQTNNQVHRVG